jgi:hypothetical protein
MRLEGRLVFYNLLICGQLGTTTVRAVGTRSADVGPIRNAAP